jgi:hypothetical protein
MAARTFAAALAGAAIALTAPAAAQADLTIAVTPNEARFGGAHHAVGGLTDAAGTPLARRRILLQTRKFPFTGHFHELMRTTTDAKGRFDFSRIDLDRNADLRAVALDGTTSGIARAFTYPAFTLRFQVVSARRIRLTQTYRTPRRVRLRAPTLFYLGRRSAMTGTVRATARPKRTSPGRFRATATVTLPKAWKGQFRYGSCFRYTPGSGMGDPARGCPKKFEF